MLGSANSGGLVATMARSAWAGLDPEGCFQHQAGRAGPFTITIPGLGAVHFFASAAATRDLLTAPGSVLAAPTPNPIEPIVGEQSVILASAEDHRRKRQMLMPALHGERMRARVTAMARAARDESAEWRPGSPIGLAATARSIALRTIIMAVFGVEEVASYQEFASVATELLHANTAALMLLPWLRRDFAGRGPWTRVVRLRGRFDELLSAQIENQRSNPSDRSVLGTLLGHENAAMLDPDDLHQQLRTLVVAGHDTTAGALMWTLYHIHRRPEIRDRVIAELASAPAPEEMPQLPYLSAVIAEALRMHPAVPIVMRRLTAPLMVGGIQWSPGDVVGVAVYGVHFDPKIWPDPHRFNPDRFLGASPSPFEYLPFGGGFRRCPGAAFAAYELAVATGTLLNTVELRMPADERDRRLPRSVPRGIAVVPHREVMLDVIGRL